MQAFCEQEEMSVGICEVYISTCSVFYLSTAVLCYFSRNGRVENTNATSSVVLIRIIYVPFLATIS